MESDTNVFYFTTLRSAKQKKSDNSKLKISRNTTLIKKLSEYNESALDNKSKAMKINDLLQNFIDSDQFIKTQESLSECKTIDNWYDNIMVRILTNSNTTKLFRRLVEKVKRAHIEKYDLDEDERKEVKIVFPEKLVFNFGNSPKQKPVDTEPIESKITALNQEIQKLEKLKESARLAKVQGVIEFQPDGKMLIKDTRYTRITEALNTDSISVKKAEKKIAKSIEKVASQLTEDQPELLAKARQLQELQSDIQKAKAKGDSTFNMNSFDQYKSLSRTIAISSNEINEVEAQVNAQIQPTPNTQAGIETNKKMLSHLQSVQSEILLAKEQNVNNFQSTTLVQNLAFQDLAEYTITEATGLHSIDQLINQRLEELYRDFYGLTPFDTYTYIGEKWVDTSKFEANHYTNTETGENSISVNMGDCQLKFPIQIADLRVVKHQTVGYLPGEIAHINNTQPGEVNTRVTRRLKKVDSFESLINEQEVFKETDTQSTDKFSVEKTASEVQAEENSVNANASVSAKYGPVKASADAGYSSTNATTNSNSFAKSYAKEVVQRVVDRVSNRVKTERNTRTIEEFEETVTHVIDNTGFDFPKSYVYRWLDKLTRAKLKNYGKRLMFNIDVAHPAHYYLSKSIEDQPKLNIPPDPRTLEINGLRMFSVEKITRQNYLMWAEIYKINLEMPPTEKIIISDTFSSADTLFINKLIPITKGYQCEKATISNTYGHGYLKSQLRFIVGTNVRAYYSGQDDQALQLSLNNETNSLPISIGFPREGILLNVEIECTLTVEAYKKWQIKCYQAIIEGYENLKAEAEAQMGEWNPNLPGVHPLKKTELIKTELKKEALKKMFRCTPFWISDDYKVGNEYQANCCKDSLHAEKVRFLETVFDWESMTWEMYDYYYADKDNWAKLLNLSDDDHMLEKFLQSSFATIQIPVHRDAQKEVAALNFMMNNSIANYETLPESLEDLLDDLSDEDVTSFEYDIDGKEVPTAQSEIDLGIFPVPTNLVILECGTENGIKPVGFPMVESDESQQEASIPKQYSPAIISDSCPEKSIVSNNTK